MLWKKYKELWLVLGYLGLLTGIWFFGISKLIQGIDGGKNKIQETIAVQESKERRLGELPKLKEQFEGVSSEEKNVADLLKREQLVSLIEKIEQLAEETGNQVMIEANEKPLLKTKTAPAKEGEPKGIIEQLPGKDHLTLVVRSTGSYSGLTRLITKIENMDYYTEVVSLQMMSELKDIKKVEVNNNPFIPAPIPASNQKKEDPQKELVLSSVIELSVYIE